MEKKPYDVAFKREAIRLEEEHPRKLTSNNLWKAYKITKSKCKKKYNKVNPSKNEIIFFNLKVMPQLEC